MSLCGKGEMTMHAYQSDDTPAQLQALHSLADDWPYVELAQVAREVSSYAAE